MKKYIIAIICLSLFSCKNNKNYDIIHINNLKYETINDSIYSRLPGDLLYQNGIIYWQDVFATENFLHAINASTGEEITSFANIGSGPEEFTLPVISLSDSSGIFINDCQKELEIYYSITNDTLITMVNNRKIDSNTTRIIHTKNKESIYLSPDAPKPFIVNSNNNNFSFGEYPIKEKITNGFDIFQGNVNYNPNNNLLVFSAILFPYIAVYNLSQKGYPLIKESQKENIEYTLKNNELKLNPDNPGATEIALTHKYIITIQKDKETEEEQHPNIIRDISSTPKSIFVYDYNLNLQKIINMKFPLLRIAGDINSDTAYLLVANPDFKIIKIEIQ